MVEITDQRKNASSMNAHTSQLDAIVLDEQEKLSWAAGCKEFARKIFRPLEFLGGAYGAGYIIGGEQLATQFAQYAILLWVNAQFGSFSFSKTFGKRREYDQKKEHTDVCDDVIREAALAQKLEEKGLFELYNPTHGVSYTHQWYNEREHERNKIRKVYWTNIDAAEKPLSLLIRNSLYGTALLLTGTLMADAAINAISYTGFNPLTWAMQQFHSLRLHNGLNDPVTNFNQLHMMAIGAAHGAVITMRQFAVGHYYKLKVKWN